MKPVQDPLSVADWRRSIAELYAAVREAPEPAQAWRRWRDDRDALFRGHPASPLDAEQRAGFTRLSYFGYDPALRFLVELEPLAATTAEKIDLGDDGILTLYPSVRTLGLSQALGAELTLYWIAGYGGGLFLPFADATCERETYGGGRYLLDTNKRGGSWCGGRPNGARFQLCLQPVLLVFAAVDVPAGLACEPIAGRHSRRRDDARLIDRSRRPETDEMGVAVYEQHDKQHARHGDADGQAVRTAQIHRCTASRRTDTTQAPHH